LVEGTWWGLWGVTSAQAGRHPVNCPPNPFAFSLRWRRYCPTPEHLLLLLTLLSMNSKASGRDAKSLKSAPGLVILWDVARLFMEAVEGDENLPPEERGGGVKQKEEMRFKQRFERPCIVSHQAEAEGSVSLSQYMNVVAAARSVVNHFSSLILS